MLNRIIFTADIHCYLAFLFCIPGCEDKSSDCYTRAVRGECYTARSWDAIFEECPKSCNQCVCGDNHQNCPDWAGRNECVQNPGWMLKQCRKSCGECSKYTVCSMFTVCSKYTSCNKYTVCNNKIQ